MKHLWHITNSEPTNHNPTPDHPVEHVNSLQQNGKRGRIVTNSSSFIIVKKIKYKP